MAVNRRCFNEKRQNMGQNYTEGGKFDLLAVYWIGGSGGSSLKNEDRGVGQTVSFRTG